MIDNNKEGLGMRAWHAIMGYVLDLNLLYLLFFVFFSTKKINNSLTFQF
jgi:hypothetical protein